MKVSILQTALEDLTTAQKFYDEQEEGVGAYFLDSLIPEIDSLSLYAGIHRIQFGFIVYWLGAFRMQFIIRLWLE